MESDFTPQEGLLVVDEALRLLATPDTFVQGTWKCSVPEVNKEGQPIIQGAIVRQARDEQGRPVYAYCIEGAINQATLNMLGPVRALELGALMHKVGTDDPSNDDLRSGQATELLSLNALADKLFGTLIEERLEDYPDDDEATRLAQIVNDYGDEDSCTPTKLLDEGGKENRLTAYENVIRMLKSKRNSLRAHLNLS